MTTTRSLRLVIAGLVPAISTRMAQRADYRDGRDKPGHDQMGKRGTAFPCKPALPWAWLHSLGFDHSAGFGRAEKIEENLRRLRILGP